MISRLRFAFLLACATAGVGCNGDSGIGPYPYGGAQNEPSRLDKLDLVPVSLDLDVGATMQLDVVFHDQYGRTMSYTGVIEYKSAHPEIAAVSNTGLVTALSAGAAVISATVRVNGVTRSASTAARILRPATGETVVLLYGDHGFAQAVTHISTGDTVIWRAGAVSWAGAPNYNVWLMDASYRDLATLDISSGTASYRFITPGTYNYCSGGCWDPPDWGVIVVN